MANYWLPVLGMLMRSACSIRDKHFDAVGMVLPDEGGTFTCDGMSITVGKFINEGLHGQVFGATISKSGQAIAVKRTIRADEDFSMECDMQNLLSKKVPGHVPSCLGLCDDGGVPGKNNVLLMDMIEGAESLTSWMQNHDDDDAKAKNIPAQTLFILTVMIRQGIANNDQMPEKNILVDGSGQVWFIDFGKACYKRNCRYPDPDGIESGMIFSVLKEFRYSARKNKYWTWDQLQEAYCCLSSVGNQELTHEMMGIAKTHDPNEALKTCKCYGVDPDDCGSCRRFKEILPMIK